jgi:hypothetical protein
MDLSAAEQAIALRDGRAALNAIDLLSREPDDWLTQLRLGILRGLALQLIETRDDPEEFVRSIAALQAVTSFDRPAFTALLTLARLAKRADLDHCAEMLYQILVPVAECLSGPMSQDWAVMVWERSDCIARFDDFDRALRLLLPIAAVADQIFESDPAKYARFMVAVYTRKTATDMPVVDADVDEGRRLIDAFIDVELLYTIEGARLRFALAGNLEACGRLDECLEIRQAMLDEMDAGILPDNLRALTEAGRDRIRTRLGPAEG